MRKALFQHLKPGAEAAEGKDTGSDDTVSRGEQEPLRRSRVRPLLGSADLIRDTAAAPVGALGQSLNEFRAKAERAEEIERRLAAGQNIVELDPALIDPSFVADRMPASAEAHASLLESMRERGQIVPILVRPHPEQPGRYQAAYGHRRVRAAAELKRPVRAVVRNLSDEELILAQGQENNERQDLSYIEKARFAYRLEERGFSRQTIMAAMSVHKGDLSQMVSVVARIPEEIVDAIGPAPGIGRRGWIELAEKLSDKAVLRAVTALVGGSDLRALDSDQRFKQVYASIRPRADRMTSETWTKPDGTKFARITQNTDKLSLTIDKRVEPEFGAFVLERLQELYEEFKARRKAEP